MRNKKCQDALDWIDGYEKAITELTDTLSPTVTFNIETIRTALQILDLAIDGNIVTGCPLHRTQPECRQVTNGPSASWLVTREFRSFSENRGIREKLKEFKDNE